MADRVEWAVYPRRMRIGMGSLAAVLLLAAIPAAPAAADEIISDDASASVQITGNWMVSTTSTGYFGDGYHFRVAGDGTSRVRWAFPSSGAAGAYEVFA